MALSRHKFIIANTNRPNAILPFTLNSIELLENGRVKVGELQLSSEVSSFREINLTFKHGSFNPGRTAGNSINLKI